MSKIDLTGFPKPVRSVLVLGLGNPILRDDGVGWRVVREVESVVDSGDGLSEPRTAEAVTPNHLVECECVSLGGLALMERMVGYERVVLVDAIQTRGGTPGAMYRLALDDLPTMHADAAHDATLEAALELGRRLGAHLPASADVAVVAIEAEDVLDFGEGLSPAVQAAVPEAVRLVLEMLSEMGHLFTTKERRNEERNKDLFDPSCLRGEGIGR